MTLGAFILIKEETALKYVLKKVRMMRVYDIATGEHKVTLNDLKTSQFTGSQETVYAEGADGAKLAAFDINKVAGYNATNGTIDDGYLAMQVGSEPVKVTNGNAILIRKVIKTEDGAAIELPYTATGEAGDEIGFIYAKDASGMPGQSYAQAAAASATEFSYDPETNIITLPADVFKKGDEVVVDFYPEFASYTMIENDSSKFSLTGRVIVDAWFTDVCTEVDVPMQLVMEKGKISGEIDISFGDQAAVQNIAVEALSTVCDENKVLWRMFTYDEQEIVG